MTTALDPTALAAGLATCVAAVGTATHTECTVMLREAARLRAWLDSAEATVTSRVRELARATAPGPVGDGALAAAAADAHSRCGGVSAAEGRRKGRRAETIEAAPSFGEALAAGEIGAEHVDALGNVAAGLAPAVRDGLFGRADELVDKARSLPPEKFGRSVRELARRLERDNGIERNGRQRRETFLTWKLNAATGMTEGRFAFHPELANQVFRAVGAEVAAMVAAGEKAGEKEFVERTVDRNRLAAEALGRLIASGNGVVRPLLADVMVLIDRRTLATGELHADSVCETGDGAALPPSSVIELVCGGRIIPVVLDERGVVLRLGRSQRVANRHQRMAMRAMHRTCAVGECDIPLDRCHAHHTHHWEHDGPTDLELLAPLCPAHHKWVHEMGMTTELHPDRRLVIRHPDGTVHSESYPDMFDHHHAPPTSAPSESADAA